MDKMSTQELMSALADGELQGEELARGLAAAAADPAALQAWHAYHLVGDVLRSDDLAGGTPPAAFIARLQAGLQADRAMYAQPMPAEAVRIDVSRPAANDSRRWKLVAGFASLAAVAAVGWTVAGVGGAGPAGPQMAAAPAPVVAGAQQGAMLRDARLDALLAAHRQFGGATVLQPTAGFLRNATFEGPAR
jgi:sigma-E factor negative regulatory protein RseA